VAAAGVTYTYDGDANESKNQAASYTGMEWIEMFLTSRFFWNILNEYSSLTASVLRGSSHAGVRPNSCDSFTLPIS